MTPILGRIQKKYLISYHFEIYYYFVDKQCKVGFKKNETNVV